MKLLSPKDTGLQRQKTYQEGDIYWLEKGARLQISVKKHSIQKMALWYTLLGALGVAFFAFVQVPKSTFECQKPPGFVFQTQLSSSGKELRVNSIDDSMGYAVCVSKQFLLYPLIPTLSHNSLVSLRELNSASVAQMASRNVIYYRLVLHHAGQTTRVRDMSESDAMNELRLLQTFLESPKETQLMRTYTNIFFFIIVGAWMITLPYVYFLTFLSYVRPLSNSQVWLFEQGGRRIHIFRYHPLLGLQKQEEIRGEDLKSLTLIAHDDLFQKGHGLCLQLPQNETLELAFFKSPSGSPPHEASQLKEDVEKWLES